jgi:hypothetical protein
MHHSRRRRSANSWGWENRFGAGLSRAAPNRFPGDLKSHRSLGLYFTLYIFPLRAAAAAEQKITDKVLD